MELASRAVHVQMSPASSGGLGCPDVALLGVADQPNLFALRPLGLHAAHGLIVEGGASLASPRQKFRLRVDAHIHHARDRLHGRSLAQHGEDLDAVGEWERVHASSDMNFYDWRQVYYFIWSRSFRAMLSVVFGFG